MPWLVKDARTPGENILFVHVPRCGGTSLTKLFNLEKKAREGVDVYHRLGLVFFFYRYRLLETSNFPMRSWENGYAAVVFTTAWIVYFAEPGWSIAACQGSEWCPPPLSISFWVMSFVTFCCSTLIFVAPMAGRQDWLRTFVALMFGKLWNNFGGTYTYLHGVNYDGYLMHYTAQKMLEHEFVKPEDLDNSFAIVRNPFSRMVSIFQYNRYGSLESFEHFVLTWKRKMDKFHRLKSTREQDVYCHVLPMHMYTHNDGVRQVPCIVKQEHLRYMKVSAKQGSGDGFHSEFKHMYSDEVPDRIMRALHEMPHANSRKTKRKWWDYYNQKTMDLVLEMYGHDFALFSYDTSISRRPELTPTYTMSELQSRFLRPGSAPVPFPSPTAELATSAQPTASRERKFGSLPSHADSGSTAGTSSNSSASIESLSRSDLASGQPEPEEAIDPSISLDLTENVVTIV